MNEPLEKVRVPPATAWRLCQRTLCVKVCFAVPQWATFTYKVADRIATSQQGIVWLIPPHKNIVMSDFAVSLDGWSVVSNGARAAASTAGGLSYEPFSRGVLNHYVLATDAEINTNKKTKADDTLWYFVAPSKFYGMHNIAYGGQLSFAISSAAGAIQCAPRAHSMCNHCVCLPLLFAGDFTSSNLNTGAAMIILECNSCASGAGIRLVRSASLATPRFPPPVLHCVSCVAGKVR